MGVCAQIVVSACAPAGSESSVSGCMGVCAQIVVSACAPAGSESSVSGCMGVCAQKNACACFPSPGSAVRGPETPPPRAWPSVRYGTGGQCGRSVPEIRARTWFSRPACFARRRCGRGPRVCAAGLHGRACGRASARAARSRLGTAAGRRVGVATVVAVAEGAFALRLVACVHPAMITQSSVAIQGK
jgi:hypothetical protein